MRKQGYKVFKKISDVVVHRISKVRGLLQDYTVERVSIKANNSVIDLPVNHASLSANLQFEFEKLSNTTSDVIYTLKNVQVTGMGTVFRNLKLFGPSVDLGTENVYRDSFLLKQWLPKRKQQRVINQEIAVVHSCWAAVNYFHWIIEAIPRLMVLKQRYPNCRLLLPSPTPEYITTTVKLLGFTHYLTLGFQEHIAVKTLLFPDVKTYGWKDQPTLEEKLRIGVLRNTILEVAGGLNTDAPFRRIYVSRSRTSVRHMINEEEFLACVHSFGFELVYFEELTFLEQVKLMQETAVFIGAHGANLTNLIFMKPGTTIIEMAAPDLISAIYYRLAAYTSLRYMYVPCDADSFDINTMTAKMDIKALKGVLDQL